MSSSGKHMISATRHPAAGRESGSPGSALGRRSPAPARHDVLTKRIYDEPARSDGCRVLVDRVWPRGITKQGAALDDWLRELAPSTELRKWFGHDPARWPEFRRRYRDELRQHAAQVKALRARAAHRRLTLLYGAKDRRLNQASVLKEVILEA